MSWKNVLSALVARRDLTDSQAEWAMTSVVRDEATPAQLAGFLLGLRAKGETPQEVEAFARALYSHSHRIEVPGVIVDIVGTGGDLAGTVNISTMATLVLAGTGVTVVKHGGRSASSPCGAADVLEELGVNLGLPPEQVARLATEAGITFCLAPLFHPGMRHAAPVRRELGVPTAFNWLAPLINPADPRHQLVGVAMPHLAPVIAQVLAARGCTSLVVRGDDGLDELTTVATSRVWLVRDGDVTESVFDPASVGIDRVAPEALRGQTLDYNVTAVRELLSGRPGPIRDAVLLNAAAALATLTLDDRPLAEQLVDPMARCADSIDTGAAADVLARWVKASTTQA
ncbi:anthranilate phosphoribosyltransferase [Flindersiella endophytica]